MLSRIKEKLFCQEDIKQVMELRYIMSMDFFTYIKGEASMKQFKPVNHEHIYR